MAATQIDRALPAGCRPRVLAAAGLGLLHGLALGLLALTLAGAGHGWTATLHSLVAVAAVPLLGVAWSYRGRAAGRRIAALLLVVMLVADGLLLRDTLGEGLTYARRAWERHTATAAGWSLLWVSWQVGVLWLLRRGRRPQAQGSQP